MYRPPAFREESRDVLYAAIRAHPLALLVTHGTSGLTANLIPFTLIADQGEHGILRAHLAKGNPQLEDLRAGAEVLVIFQGPQAYVTPSWYPTKQEHGKVVPTWNYVMVQVRGTATVIDDPIWLRAQVGALTDQQERNRTAPWSVDDAPEAFIDGQLKVITGIEITVTRIEGKWKASQNQPAANREGVAKGLLGADPTSAMGAYISGAAGLATLE
jgi:transcriptional regulator